MTGARCRLLASRTSCAGARAGRAALRAAATRRRAGGPSPTERCATSWVCDSFFQRRRRVGRLATCLPARQLTSSHRPSLATPNRASLLEVRGPAPYGVVHRGGWPRRPVGAGRHAHGLEGDGCRLRVLAHRRVPGRADPLQPAGAPPRVPSSARGGSGVFLQRETDFPQRTLLARVTARCTRSSMCSQWAARSLEWTWVKAAR